MTANDTDHVTHSDEEGLSADGLARLMEQRRLKADQLRSLGVNPYGNTFSPDHTAAVVSARFSDIKPAQPHSSEPLSDERFSIAGRIVEHRSFGKAAFVKLLDRSGRLQVYVKKDVVGEAAFEIFKHAEMWDFLGVKGYAFFTKTGELTLMAETVQVLTKAVRPPPEKWSGLKDQETRYRQRYVDLVTNPDVAHVFVLRTKIIQFLRRFLDARDFLEVETPLLHSILGGAAARPFCTHHNALNMPLYMRIAPELYLKRLVVGGFERVYEIGRNFRNEGLSRQHNPEFTMLEFYMAYATYEDLIELTEEMFTALCQELHGTTTLTYQGQHIDFSRPWPRLAVKDAVVIGAKQLSRPLQPHEVDDQAALQRWCDEVGLTSKKDALGEALRNADSHGARIAALFDHLGEVILPADRPCFVVDYPAATSPLARRKESNPDLVDRFELFICGREMANAFSELNDPDDQRRRFEDQLKMREKGDAEAMEYDEDYCRALEYGMPPAAGQGIGIDRLVMLMCDQGSIRDVLLFPHMRAER